MEVTYIRADPAGNITLLVTSPVPAEDRAKISGALLAMPELDAEQVGFVVPPQLGGDARVEMMGGEFCGNALRAAALYTARQTGAADGTVLKMEISGAKEPLEVRVHTGSGEVTAQIPFPRSVEEETVCGLPMGVVVFDGIVHGVLESDRPDEAQARTVTRALLEQYPVGAAGLMYLSWKGGEYRVEPFVYVAATDTMFHERSCASGSAAVACYLSDEQIAGIFTYALHQQGGLLKATTVLEECACLSVSVSGPVILGESCTATV